MVGPKAFPLGIAAVAVLAVTPVGPAGVDHVIYPRDETEFFAYVEQYVPGWASSELKGVPERDRAWLQAHPDAVLAEGEAACEWLVAQPLVPDLVPSGDADVGAMITRYRRATVGSAQVYVHEWTRSGVVAGAWAYLCPATRETRTSPASGETD